MPALSASIRRRTTRHGQHGQDMAEFAIAAPLVLLLLLGIMEFGVVVMQYNTIANAAREGARYGVIQAPPRTEAEVEAAARALTPGLDQARLTVQVTFTPGTGYTTGTVTVLVTYQAQLISAPVIRAVGGTGLLTLSTHATMNLEQPRS